jgi:hypothetical protein
MTLATPELSELLQAAAEQAAFELHTSIPGQIVALYTDASTRRQYADVLPMLKRALPVDPEDDALTNPDRPPFVYEQLPILPMVPIAYPQGGGFFAAWPLVPGDHVLVVFAERSLDRWVSTARRGSQKPLGPGDVGTHTLAGAIALPLGPAPLPDLLQSVYADAMTLGHDAGKQIAIKQNTVNLGSYSPTDAVALASKTNTGLTSGENDVKKVKDATATAISSIETVLAGLTGAVPPASIAVRTAFDAAVVGVPHAHTSVASTVVLSD